MQANRVPVQIKIIDTRLVTDFGGIPHPATSEAAACDVVACAFIPRTKDGKPDLAARIPIETGRPLMIYPGEVVFIGLGFAARIMETSYAAFMIPRSGMGSVKGLVLANTVGLLDPDYEGEWLCPAMNRNRAADGRVAEPLIVRAGDRIAQFWLGPVVHADYEIVESFRSGTSRGSGGFGSTG